jgi:hypothetical protein
MRFKSVRPVEALRALRGLLAERGTLLLADERVGDTFGGAGDDIERLDYGLSILHCLPASRSESPSAAIGTVMRLPVVQQLVSAAGFSELQVLPIENDFWRFYRLIP